jgi:hypothetical protein
MEQVAVAAWVLFEISIQVPEYYTLKPFDF